MLASRKNLWGATLYRTRLEDSSTPSMTHPSPWTSPVPAARVTAMHSCPVSPRQSPTFPQPTFCFFMQLALVHAAPSASAAPLPSRSLFILHGTSSHSSGAGQGLQPRFRTDLPASREQAKGCSLSSGQLSLLLRSRARVAPAYTTTTVKMKIRSGSCQAKG